MKLNGMDLEPVHFREKYIDDILKTNINLEKTEKIMFPSSEENKLIFPNNVNNPSMAEAEIYLYSVRKKQFIERFQNRFNVAIFGSARSKEHDPEYKHFQDLVMALAEEFKLGIITGGGPGIMKAGNTAAVNTREKRLKESKASNIKSVGINLELPFELLLEEDGSVDKRRIHQSFFTRIPDMIDFSNGAYAAPGGVGTLLPEAGFILQLKQVRHLEQQFPLIMHSMYQKTLDSIYETMYQTRKEKGLTTFISEDDLSKNILVTDKIYEIVAKLKEAETWWRKYFCEPYKKIKETR